MHALAKLRVAAVRIRTCTEPDIFVRKVKPLSGGNSKTLLLLGEHHGSSVRTIRKAFRLLCQVLRIGAKITTCPGSSPVSEETIQAAVRLVTGRDERGNTISYDDILLLPGVSKKTATAFGGMVKQIGGVVETMPI